VTRTRRTPRLAELERIAAGVVRARSGNQPEADGTSRLTLERSGDELTFTWSLPPETASPALQLLLLVRGADGVETETRTLTLDAPSGRTTVSAPALHSVHAAVGRLEGARFVPSARLSP
jgi:hypothetical protein